MVRVQFCGKTTEHKVVRKIEHCNFIESKGCTKKYKIKSFLEFLACYKGFCLRKNWTKL